MTYSDQIISFLESHPAISVNRVEKDLKIPRSTLVLNRAKERGIPKKHIFPLICYLADYGLKINGYTLTYDKAIDSIFGRKFVSVEDFNEEENSYTVKEYRMLATSYFDL